MSPQLTFPFAPAPRLSRADFIVAPANAEAVAFIDSWPDWPVTAAALHGPPGSGKSHLASTLAAATLIEDVDSTPATAKRDAALFSALERATREAPVLLTGREPPALWETAMPDLASRFKALLAFPLWAPDDALLSALARKLFADRQLMVPDAVIQAMLHRLERSPSALRIFVDRADARALAEKRAVTVGLIQELIA
ncbi:MAG: chromosomal replication initiator DnaA [Rhizomicrobium sp.]